MLDDAKLQKSERFATLGAVATLIVFVVLIILSASGLNSLETKRKKLGKEVGELEKKSAQLAELNDSLNRANSGLKAFQRERVEAAVGQYSSPLQDSIAVKASARSLGEYADGTPRFDFSLWIEAPAGVMRRITRVEYYFDHPTFKQKLYTSRNPADGFKVNYESYGALRLVTVTVRTADEEVRIPFNMVAALGWE
jgi:hypothetical protein